MEPKLITKTLSVKGMTCANCENRIENNIKKINGIINVTASYTRSQVKFAFDGNYVGLLTGLMPCGPLQAMQLYALSTGDPVKG